MVDLLEQAMPWLEGKWVMDESLDIARCTAEDWQLWAERHYDRTCQLTVFEAVGTRYPKVRYTSPCLRTFSEVVAHMVCRASAGLKDVRQRSPFFRDDLAHSLYAGSR